MNQGLVSAWASVALFWAIVLAMFSGVPLVWQPAFLAWSIGVALAAALFGLVGWLVFSTFFRKTETSALLAGDRGMGIEINIGNLPNQSRPAEASVSSSLFDGYIDMPSYRSAYPAHAALLEAMARVMATKPDLPASHVPGGHGGATLIQHSLNVIQSMHQVCGDWKFEGHRNKDGTFWYQANGTPGKPYHQFSPIDPILPLAAFGHDIGKIVCYEQENGKVTEKTVVSFAFEGAILDSDKSKRKKVPHDTEGARLLRRLPELWELPHEDMNDLLVAIGYYHKVGTLPLSVSERAHSLTELLLHADVQAGFAEDGGRHPMEDGGANYSFIGRLPDGTPVGSSSVTPESSEASAPSEDPDLISDDQYDAFMEVLADPNRVNGRDARERIGFKYGEWIYISDVKLRSVLSKQRGDPTYLENKNPDGNDNRGVMHPWTRKLLKRLEANGLLMTEFDGMTFSYKRALFNTVSITEGHEGKEEKFVMVVKSSILPSINSLENCKTAPKITKCSWGNSAAINKNITFDINQNAYIESKDSSESAVEKSAFGISDSDDTRAEETIDQADDSSWNLIESLKKVIRFEEEGPAFIERKTANDQKAMLFELDEVVAYYGIEESDLAGLQIIKGGASGKTFVVIGAGEGSAK